MTGETFQKVPRIALLDFARGVALIAMTVFHFTVDLQIFGQIAPGTISQPGWVLFARSIAGSFLFLVGVSLFLAHGNGIRWPGFLKRLLAVIAGAALITVGTYNMFPRDFIFFGILHQIALASLLGLLFLRSSVALIVAIAAIVLSLPYYARTELLDAPIWWWTGLSRIIPISSDYVPVFPWFGVVLLGIAAGKYLLRSELLFNLADIQLDDAVSRVLRFIGRHSLIYYLLHQPIMFGLLWAYLKATGNIL